MNAINRVKALVVAAVAAASVSGCQTTDPTHRSMAAKGPAAVRCERMDDHRKDCEDQVGCYWVFDASKCAAN